MKSIIIGAGKIGFNIAQTLSAEGHDVYVIDKDLERKQTVEDILDVQAVYGNGATAKVLESVDVEHADLLIAVTESDELNMLACMLARQYGVKKTVARVRNPEYDADQLAKNPALKIDLMINPERVAASEIAKIISIPEAMDVNYYARGRIILMELLIEKNNPSIGLNLKEIQQIDTNNHFLVAAISRQSELIIPRGDDVLMEGDRVFLIGRTEEMRAVEKSLGFTREVAKKVMIVGGSRVAFYLAQILEQRGIEVKLVEKSEKHCKFLAGELDETIILHGDGSDIDFLRDEGIADTDIFISLTEDDKLNVLVALMAKRMKAKRTIAQVRRSDYLPLLEAVGIDFTVSPRLLAAEAVLAFLRNEDFLSISVLEEGSAEVYEVLIQEGMSRMAHKKLKDMKLPRGILVGAIYRDNDVIIPSGNDELIPGDRVIIFTVAEMIHKVEHFVRLDY